MTFVRTVRDLFTAAVQQFRKWTEPVAEDLIQQQVGLTRLLRRRHGGTPKRLHRNLKTLSGTSVRQLTRYLNKYPCELQGLQSRLTARWASRVS